MDYVEQRMTEEAAKGPARQVPDPNNASQSQRPLLTRPSDSLFTPLNLILASALLYTVYALLRAPAKHDLARPPPPVVFRTYTPRTLLPLNGEGGNPVYLAVRGKVFDVTSGRNFYGPGGPYANFAGRDASRGLAFGSFDEDMLTEDLDGPLDKLEDLGADQIEALEGWEARFNEKYDVIGKLVSVEEFNATEKK